jgi:two-component system phosphate regulon sensor histidine kinase PhoR
MSRPERKPPLRLFRPALSALALFGAFWLVALTAGASEGAWIVVALPVSLVGGLFVWMVEHDSAILNAAARARMLEAGEEPAKRRIPLFGLSQRVLQAFDRQDRRLRERMADELGGQSNAALYLEAMRDPLIVIDRGRRVRRANRAARDLLGPRIVGADVSLAIRSPTILEAVEEVEAGAEPRVLRYVVPGAVERHFEAYVSAARWPNAPEGGAAESAPVVMIHLRDQTELRRSERMRNDFIANVSHELRTPLSTLLGFIETIRGPARDDPSAQQRFLAIMDEQAHRMNRLVTDLLSLAKIELEEHTPPTQSVELDTVIGAVAATLELKAAKRKVKIRLDLPKTLPPVIGDEDQLVQVFQNLIDNAIKYGGEGGEIRIVRETEPAPSTLAVAPAERFLTVAVVDRGPGIPREHIPRLTERFYRASSAKGGTGLGLAIVKHIVNRHRGRFRIESEEGQGSRFIVSLPLAPPPPGETAALGRPESGAAA